METRIAVVEKLLYNKGQNHENKNQKKFY